MKTIKLSQLKNMMRVMAQKEIELKGEYFCLFKGKRVRVVD